MDEHRFVVPYQPVGTTYGAAELAALRDCLLSGETLSCGRQRDAFEREFAELVGVRHAISLPGQLHGRPAAMSRRGLLPMTAVSQ